MSVGALLRLPPAMARSNGSSCLPAADRSCAEYSMKSSGAPQASHVTKMILDKCPMSSRRLYGHLQHFDFSQTWTAPGARISLKMSRTVKNELTGSLQSLHGSRLKPCVWTVDAAGFVDVRPGMQYLQPLHKVPSALCRIEKAARPIVASLQLLSN